MTFFVFISDAQQRGHFPPAILKTKESGHPGTAGQSMSWKDALFSHKEKRQVT
jgi:hypothetical protein